MRTPSVAAVHVPPWALLMTATHTQQQKGRSNSPLSLTNTTPSKANSTQLHRSLKPPWPNFNPTKHPTNSD
eukprot:12749636-Ditylum_brightwellii.AAC.1